jgi:hypothetical protein
MDSLTITRPDDWHLHLRDGAAMAAVLPDTARRFARAIVMPNLKPPVTTVALAAAYRERILAALPAGMGAPSPGRPKAGRANKFAPNHVKVVTEAGVVFLLGMVTQVEATDAVEIARTTGGVQKVVRVFELVSPEQARALDNLPPAGEATATGDKPTGK